MRLHRLRVQAFGPFGGVQEVDFADLSRAGLFLLHGPTGAGKTSVLDAVCYALYGTVPGSRNSGQGTGLRSDHAAPDTVTEVTLDLTAAGRRVEVTRRPPWTRPKKRGDGTTKEKAYSALREYDTARGAWKDLSRSHQEIGEEIKQLLGMSKEQFCQVVLLPQGDFAKFLRADAEVRGRLLGRLFDTHRFADVEQHLAQRRRQGEAAVRDADTELLALANQMVTAAGDSADAPLPDPAPGEPGLSDAVLAWAATVRVGARERVTRAECALEAAEARHRTARDTAREAGELHRLQTRFARARERAASLAERAAADETDRLRLERGRKADTVAPALELRADAEARHRDAVTAETHARAALTDTLTGPERHAVAPTGSEPRTEATDGTTAEPDVTEPDVTDLGLTDLDAAGLTAAARTATEELGGLESARRAERRLAALADERAGARREDRADQDIIQDATGWLGDWESTRTALRHDIDRAQEAVARAEHLAGQLEPARRRLDSARLRDRLTDHADEAGQAVRDARTRADDARQHWLDLKEQRLSGIAAELAAALTDGAPCGVCGSVEHPHPARRSPGHVDRATEDRAHTAYQRADAARDEATREHARLREELAAATAGAGDEPAEALAAAVGTLRDELAGAHRTASGLHAAQEALDRAEDEHARRVAAQQEAARRAAARASRREALERETAGLEAELTHARGTATSVAARAAELELRVTLLTDAADAVRTAADTAHRLKEADARAADAAFRAGFDTPGAAAAARLDGAAHRELQHRVDLRSQEETEVRVALTEVDTAAAAARPPADPVAAERIARDTERVSREAASRLAAAIRDRDDLERLSARATAAARALAPRREEHDRIARLAALTAGTSTANEHRMRLESYVLAARLEQVAAAATLRLTRMSQGRYTLVHSDDRTGRGRSGLGLHVVDAWTGRERDTATLSGGETFFVSLALALGLADVVTDEAGGVRLDTLFIDEGFGSLDEETLDEVLDVLDSLRERDRCVGIVSHVADLRRRVHARLEVVKGRDGSVVRQRGAAG
ncbi:SMC family ATPase [Streptomyces uncialis]|uniref:SMC family ATPase n=1 Tax=Streptomyces uncialis TaxID=1048205 RepID=UPI002E34A457|nr:SMC family ATPase [Streptomyces uncialis]